MKTQPNAQPDYPTPKPAPADLPDVGPTITGYPNSFVDPPPLFERGFMAPPGSTPQQKADATGPSGMDSVAPIPPASTLLR